MITNFKPLLGLLNIKLILKEYKDEMRIDVIMSFKDSDKNPEGLAPFSIIGTPEDIEKALPETIKAIIANNINSINNIELITKQLKAKEEAISNSNKKKTTKKEEPIKKKEPDLFAETPKKEIPAASLTDEQLQKKIETPITKVEEKPAPVVQETPSVKTIEPVIEELSKQVTEVLAETTIAERIHERAKTAPIPIPGGYVSPKTEEEKKAFYGDGSASKPVETLDEQAIEELYKEKEEPEDFHMTAPRVDTEIHTPNTTIFPQGKQGDDWSNNVREQEEDNGSLF